MNLPRSWRQVTLKQFIALEALPETENKITRIVGQVSVLTGISENDIRNWKPAKLEKTALKLSFITSLPKERKAKYFYHKWRLYKRADMNNTTVAQVTDIMTLNNNTENVGEKVLNALAVLYYRRKNTEYDADRFKQMKAELESLDFQTAMNSSAFFFAGLKKYLPGVLARFLKKQTTRTIEKLIHETGTLSDLNAYAKFINGTTLQ